MLRILSTLFVASALIGSSYGDFIDDVVERHNHYRALHGVEDVTANSTITAYAQAFATYLDTNGLWMHNPNASSEGYGENLSWSSSSALTGSAHVDNLYVNEANFYAENNYCGGEPDMTYFNDFGHYTQIVWEASLQIGVGKSSGFVVINYSPQGNFFNRFADNVPCPTS